MSPLEESHRQESSGAQEMDSARLAATKPEGASPIVAPGLGHDAAAHVEGWWRTRKLLHARTRCELVDDAAVAELARRLRMLDVKHGPGD